MRKWEVSNSVQFHLHLQHNKMNYKLPNQPKSQILFYKKTQPKDFIRNTLPTGAAVVTRIQFPVLNSDEVIACQSMESHRFGHDG